MLCPGLLIGTHCRVFVCLKISALGQSGPRTLWRGWCCWPRTCCCARRTGDTTAGRRLAPGSTGPDVTSGLSDTDGTAGSSSAAPELQLMQLVGCNTGCQNTRPQLACNGAAVSTVPVSQPQWHPWRITGCSPPTALATRLQAWRTCAATRRPRGGQGAARRASERHMSCHRNLLCWS